MKRFKANLSNTRLLSGSMGQMYPIQLQEVLPGDTMRLSTSSLIRVAPMIAPVMHPVTVRVHHWFVPNRIIWEGWEDFITGGPNNENADVVPQITMPATPSKNLVDYLGVRPLEGVEFSALPVRAFNKIYNEFYRDQDLVAERTEDDLSIPRCAWRKDYFTAARPFQQKGPDIVLPIGDSAPINSDITPGNYAQITVADDGTVFPGADNEDEGQLIADLANATGVTATEFREFFALQRYAEARARYGSRYTEYLRYQGVNPSDARLQRPEYLGGGKTTLQFSEVLQTAEGSDPVGTLRGHGISALRSKPTRRFFEEHGYVISILSVVPKSIYQDGMHRTWLRKDKEDFFQKELQSIGQQQVYADEVYATPDRSDDNLFGYQDRYSDYLSTPSGVSGEFRDVLDYWHLARKFQTEPVLNAEFVECNPSNRIFAEQTMDHLWIMVNNNCVARRQVKKTAIGKLL